MDASFDMDGPLCMWGSARATALSQIGDSGLMGVRISYLQSGIVLGGWVVVVVDFVPGFVESAWTSQQQHPPRPFRLELWKVIDHLEP